MTRIHKDALKAGKLHVDDAPVPMPVLGEGKTAQARLWAYVVDDRPSDATTPALVWYRFTPDRSGIHPQTELKRIAGLLQADGYAYDFGDDWRHLTVASAWRLQISSPPTARR